MAEKKGKLSELIPDDKNLNKHTQYGMSLLEKSVRGHKFGRSILVDKNNRIIAGNGIVETAANIGAEDIRIIETTGDELVVVKRTDVDLDTKEGREMALADNATSAADLEWDMEKMEEIESEWDIDVSDWGIDLPEEEEEAHDDDFDEDEIQAEPVCKEGDIWQLGEHRLMCGDSTDKANVSILTEGCVADISFFSPPYNAGFGANLTKHNGRKSKYINYDDNKSQCDYFDFLQASIDNAMDHSKFVFCNIQMLSNNKRALIELLHHNIDILGDIIIWDKSHAQPAAAERVLNSVFEFVLVFHNGGTRAIGTKKFHGNLDNIVRIKPTRNEYSKEHNAVFPIEFPYYFVQNFSTESVIDLFGGSGTTLIACEQLGRKCYMMELDPHYCDVIIARWEKLTGQKARKVFEK